MREVRGLKLGFPPLLGEVGFNTRGEKIKKIHLRYNGYVTRTDVNLVLFHGHLAGVWFKIQSYSGTGVKT